MTMGKKIVRILFPVFVMLQLMSCESALDAEVYSELSSDEVLNSRSGIESVLNEAYANAHLPFYDAGLNRHYFSAMSSGLAWNRGGRVESIFTQLTNFTWESSLGSFEDSWAIPYEAIRDANILLDKLNSDNEFHSLVRAEARFIRGWSYYQLYNYFGPTPIYTSPSDDSNLPRPSEEEIKSFIEQDLIFASENLPITQDVHGRATEGAALGLLCKFYLNTKRWQKAADIAQQIIELDRYSLIQNYADVFSINNEENNQEILWSLVRTSSGAAGNIGAAQYLNAHTFPLDYPLPSNQSVYAANTYLFDKFVNSFEMGDSRREMIVTKYTNTSGQQNQLLGNDRSLSLKYEFDPNANGPGMGNDMPVVRYADILLARAEALNEFNAPNQESIDLINEVRERANVPLLNLGDFPSKESLRNRIMQEWEWEFYFEGKRREDQIRAGTFIQKAKDRGHNNAMPYHRVFPIPLSEINANSNLIQNEGY